MHGICRTTQKAMHKEVNSEIKINQDKILNRRQRQLKNNCFKFCSREINRIAKFSGNTPTFINNLLPTKRLL